MRKKSLLLQKLAFASCDVFGGGSFNIINFLYPGFMALTLGLSPYWIGFVVLITRLWDAVNDPLMGKITDSTSSKMGKRRIYLVAASPLVLVAFILLFFPFAFNNTALKVITALACYLLFCTVETLVMIPYYSLSSEISSDYNIRASYNSWRLGFSIFSSIVCVAVPGMIVSSFEGNEGYIVMGVIFGAVFALAVLVTGLFAKEEIDLPPSKGKGFISEYAGFFKIKPFRQYIGMFLSVQTAMTVMSTLFFFFIDFYVCRDVTLSGRASMMGSISAAIMFSMQIVALPFYLWVIKKTSKSTAYRIGAAIWIISALFLLAVKPGAPDYFIYILAAIIGFGISGPGLVPHTMFGDISDFIQLSKKQRIDGQISGCANFMNKLVQAVSMAAVMAVLGLFGFIEKKAGGADVLSQPESAQNALLYIMSFAPLFTVSIGVFISFKYKLSRDRQNRIADLLQAETMDESKRDEIITELQQ